MSKVTDSLIFIGNDLSQLKSVKNLSKELPSQFAVATDTVIEDIMHFNNVFALSMYKECKKVNRSFHIRRTHVAVNLFIPRFSPLKNILMCIIFPFKCFINIISVISSFGFNCITNTFMLSLLIF